MHIVCSYNSKFDWLIAVIMKTFEMKIARLGSRLVLQQMTAAGGDRIETLARQ